MSSEKLERARAYAESALAKIAEGMSPRDRYEFYCGVENTAVNARDEVAEACPDCATCDGNGWVDDEEYGGTKSCPARCINGKDLGP